MFELLELTAEIDLFNGSPMILSVLDKTTVLTVTEFGAIIERYIAY